MVNYQAEAEGDERGSRGVVGERARGRASALLQEVRHIHVHLPDSTRPRVRGVACAGAGTIAQQLLGRSGCRPLGTATQ
eukprot:SAG25_NODE_521_length_7225_cov_3.656890_2_plen_79_part_00